MACHSFPPVGLPTAALDGQSAASTVQREFMGHCAEGSALPAASRLMLKAVASHAQSKDMAKFHRVWGLAIVIIPGDFIILETLDGLDPGGRAGLFKQQGRAPFVIRR